jgi:hypothetical protein
MTMLVERNDAQRVKTVLQHPCLPLAQEAIAHWLVLRPGHGAPTDRIRPYSVFDDEV